MFGRRAAFIAFTFTIVFGAICAGCYPPSAPVEPLIATPDHHSTDIQATAAENTAASLLGYAIRLASGLPVVGDYLGSFGDNLLLASTFGFGDVLSSWFGAAGCDHASAHFASAATLFGSAYALDPVSAWVSPLLSSSANSISEMTKALFSRKDENNEKTRAPTCEELIAAAGTESIGIAILQSLHGGVINPNDFTFKYLISPMLGTNVYLHKSALVECLKQDADDLKTAQLKTAFSLGIPALMGMYALPANPLVDVILDVGLEAAVSTGLTPMEQSAVEAAGDNPQWKSWAPTIANWTAACAFYLGQLVAPAPPIGAANPDAYVAHRVLRTATAAALMNAAFALTANTLRGLWP